MFLVLPDLTGSNFSLFLREFRDSFNFRSKFLKFAVMENYSNGFQSVLFDLMAKATYIRLLRGFSMEKCCFFSGNFLKIC